MAVTADAAGVVYALVSFRGRPLQWAFLAAVAPTTAWQLRMIFPYLPVASIQVERTRAPSPGSRFRLLDPRLGREASGRLEEQAEAAVSGHDGPGRA